MGRHIRPASAALAACMLVAGAAGLSACSSSKKPAPAGNVGAPASGSTGVAATATADTRARPAAVPAAAGQARAEVELGAASGGDAETLASMNCDSGLLTITTSAHVIYAELPCDRALPDANVKPFVGQPIHVRAVPSNPAKLYLDSSAAGSVEFTVGRVWVASG